MKTTILLTSALLCTSIAQAATITADYSSGDGVVINQVQTDGTLVASDRPNVGAFKTDGSGNRGFNGFYFFELPTLSIGSTIEGANFSAFLTVMGGTINSNMDLYLYGSDTLGATAGDYQTTTGTLGSGDNPNNWHGTRIADNFLTPSSINNQTYNVTDDALLASLQSLYTDGSPTSTYAVIRAQMDWDSDATTETIRYRLNSHKDGLAIPSLTLDYVAAVPEPSSSILLGLGGLSLIMRRNKQN